MKVEADFEIAELEFKLILLLLDGLCTGGGDGKSFDFPGNKIDGLKGELLNDDPGFGNNKGELDTIVFSDKSIRSNESELFEARGELVSLLP